MSWTARLRKFFETGLTLPGLRGALQKGEIPYGAGCVDELEAGGLVLGPGQTIVGGNQGVPVATGGAAVVTVPTIAQSTFVRFRMYAASDGEFRYGAPYLGSLVPAYQELGYTRYRVRHKGTLRAFTQWGTAQPDPVLEIIVNGTVLHEETLDHSLIYTQPHLYDLSSDNLSVEEGDIIQLRVKADTGTTRFLSGNITLQILHEDDAAGGFNMMFGRDTQNPTTSQTPFVADGAFGATFFHFPSRVQLQRFSIASVSATSTTRIPIHAGRSYVGAVNNRVGTLVVGGASGAGEIEPPINIEAVSFIGLAPDFFTTIAGTDPGIASVEVQGVALS